MADRYVNYDKLLEERHRLGLDETSKIHKVNAFNQFIDRMPTADVAEVKHGEWISASPCGYYDFYCSCCKEFAITYEDSNYRERYHLTDYCPFCGAKMDGGKAE